MKDSNYQPTDGPIPVGKPLLIGLFFVLGLFGTRLAWAQTGPQLFLNPWDADGVAQFDADAADFQAGHLDKTDESTHLSIYDTEGRFRLIPGQVASPRFGYDFTYLDLGNATSLLPRQFVDQSAALAFPVAKYGNWIVIGSAGAGYAGNTPFGDGNAVYGLGSVSLVRTFSDKEAFIIVLEYDGHRTVMPDIPLPGIVYYKQVDPTLDLALGVPITTIDWTPAGRLHGVHAHLGFDLLDVDAKLGYDVLKDVTLFAGYRYDNLAFHMNSLPRGTDRMFFEQQRVETGVTWHPWNPSEWQDFELTVAGGYAYHGRFNTGFDELDLHGVTKISDEPYLRLELTWKF